MATILDKLRLQPESTMLTHDLFFDSRGYTPSVIQAAKEERGGACTFTCGAPDKRGVATVTVAKDGRDYFFPWVPRGVGWVAVPVAAPNGTIVATGQLNGCTFEVIQAGTQLYFYHDGDSKYLRRTVQPVAGTTVCLVPPAAYMPNNLGITLMQITQQHATAASDRTRTRAYCYQLFAVKQDGKWHVFSCGLLLFNGVPTDAFKDTQLKLVDTFAPAQSPAAAAGRARSGTM